MLAKLLRKVEKALNDPSQGHIEMNPKDPAIFPPERVPHKDYEDAAAVLRAQGHTVELDENKFLVRRKIA